VRISVCNQLRATGWALRSYKWNKIHRLWVIDDWDFCGN
jgi:hypothetical protein